MSILLIHGVGWQDVLAQFRHKDPTWLSGWLRDGRVVSPEFLFPVALVLGLGQLPGCVGSHRYTAGPVWAEAGQAPTKEHELLGPL